jgi:hypothetical protein
MNSCKSMRRLKFIVFILLIAPNIRAQYRNLTFQDTRNPLFKIIQIDFMEYSTLIHFQYTNKEAFNFLCLDENIYIKDRQTFRKYKLINSINLPTCGKRHLFDGPNQLLNFTLEFEYFPPSIGSFDILENNEKGINIYGVSIDTLIKSKEFLDIQSFIDETPIKEYNYYFKDGNIIQFYNSKGLFISVALYYDKNYGKYYQSNILIQNRTGKDITIYPNSVYAKYYKGKKEKNQIDITKIIELNEFDKLSEFSAHVLSYEEFNKKVKNRQAWSAFAFSFSQSMAAASAGYSYSSTQSTINSYSNSNFSANGYIGRTYGNINGNINTSSTSTIYNTTRNYDGAAAHAASQKASENISNLKNNQYEIKKTINEGYVKINTIMNETQYSGFFNIDYENADNFKLIIPIDKTNYLFIW